MKTPTVEAKGIAFVATLKDRNQITVDSTVVDLLELEKGKNYQFLVVVKE